MAEVGQLEIMRAVTISRRVEIVGSADSEMVGEDVVSETVRCALLETDLSLEDESDDGSERRNQSGVAGWDIIVLLFYFHDC